MQQAPGTYKCRVLPPMPAYMLGEPVQTGLRVEKDPDPLNLMQFMLP